MFVGLACVITTAGAEDQLGTSALNPNPQPSLRLMIVPLQVDTTWRDLMEAAHGNPSVLVLAKDPEHLARLEEANKLLEEIQKVGWSFCVAAAEGVSWPIGHFMAIVDSVPRPSGCDGVSDTEPTRLNAQLIKAEACKVAFAAGWDECSSVRMLHARHTAS